MYSLAIVKLLATHVFLLELKNVAVLQRSGLTLRSDGKKYIVAIHPMHGIISRPTFHVLQNNMKWLSKKKRNPLNSR